MEDIWSNPWFIGIGGGILSGLVVTVITRFVFARRDNREYLQKVEQANREVLYAIRPGISEGVIPTNAVIRRLISSTARQYGVREESMNTLGEVSSDLIKEVMDSSFISASAKEKFCEQLAEIRDEQSAQDAETPRPLAGNEYRRMAVMMMGLMAGMMTALSGFALVMEKDKQSEPLKLVILLVPALVAILVSVLTVLFKELERMKLRRMDVSIKGLRAEFRSRDRDDSDA